MPTTDIAIHDVTPEDAQAMCRVYNYHVRNTIVTLEEADVSEAERTERVASVCAAFPWLVTERGEAFLGYAYAAQWHERSAYRHSVMSTIYLDGAAYGQGIGTALYRALLERLRARPVDVVVGGVSLPNAASIALHEKCGYRKIMHFEQVGFKFGQWIDVGYWQRAI